MKQRSDRKKTRTIIKGRKKCCSGKREKEKRSTEKKEIGRRKKMKE